jgi:predicted short-subunit dehydrogenase-like oxidoreductase (DUF2520 family)
MRESPSKLSCRLSCSDRYPTGNWIETVSQITSTRRFAIIGPGRLGRALAAKLDLSGQLAAGPLARGYPAAELAGAEVLLLCVPDREIKAAAETVIEGMRGDRRCPMVAHCSGASTLAVLDPVPLDRRLSLHPLTTLAADQPAVFDGVSAAVAGHSAEALAVARELASGLGMTAFEIEDADRGAYHAAASIASNFLVTLESAAERLAASAGCDRDLLIPLVRQTVSNWAAAGSGSLTGPIARGDEATVERQRQAVAQRTPELLALFDALSEATRTLYLAEVAA